MTNTTPLFQITTMHDGGSEVHEWPGTDAADVVESFTAYLDACASIPHIPWLCVEPADRDGRSIWTSPLPEVHGEFALAVQPV